jgi:flagellar biosynthesis protein FlhF
MNSVFMREDVLTERFQRMIWQSVKNSQQAAAIYAEFRKLVSDGVSENLSFLLLQEAAQKLPSDEDIRDRLKLRLNRAISRAVTVSPYDLLCGPRACIFLGPTGVGKTTTLAKIAARLALKEKRKIQLLTFDTYRIAAAEQLKIYGEIIGIPVRVIFSVAELDEALQEARSDEIVLIDTTGHSHKRISEYSELAGYIRDNSSIEKHLVLSTTTRPENLSETVECFGTFGPQKLIFTKLDESSCYGVILNELIRTEKPLSYLTDGQDVAEDLIIPGDSTLADLLVPIC